MSTVRWVDRLVNPRASATIGFGLTLWGFWLGVRQLSDNSYFTHLATGRLILDSGSVPVTDPYSFTANGEGWVVQSWLASVLYAFVDGWLGPGGVRVLTGLLTAVVTLLTWRLTRSANLVVRVAATSMVLIIGGVMWSPRPLLFGLVFMGLTLLAAKGDLNALWLVPVYWFWANSHGSFPLGLVALGVLYAGARWDKQQARNELDGLKWALVGTALAVLPLGPKILVFPIEILRRSESLQQIIEWQSPSFLTAWSRLYLIQIVVTVLALVRRPSWRGALAAVVFVSASLLGQRNVAVASLVLAVVIADGLSGLGNLKGADRSVMFALAGSVMVVILIAACSVSLEGPSYELSSYPTDAVSWLDRSGAIARPGIRLATPDTTGNYLELIYGPRAQVFVDDRVDMYPKKIVDQAVALIHGTSGWREALDSPNGRSDQAANVVLWERGGPLAEILTESDQWRILYEDGKWMIGCRRGAQVGALAC